MTPNYLEVCETAARAGGEVLLQLEGKTQVREKGPNDLVTEADYASQQRIREVLLDAFPDHQFVGEESDGASAILARSRGWQTENGLQAEKAFRWIVDPLDGTTNYVHSLRNYCVSVALERQGEILAGVVYDPCADECFRAAPGRGAELNGQKLQASGCQQLADALVAMSLPAHVTRRSADVQRLLKIIEFCQSVRRLGSAALNLCYVAAGRLDAYVAASIKPWDVAAGALIVREAGAQLSGLGGGEFDLFLPELLCAATPQLQRELFGALAGIESVAGAAE